MGPDPAQRHLRVVSCDVIVAAAPPTVFEALVDWAGQSRWMLATTVRSEGAAHAVGGRISAFTGIGPVGFLDTMVISEWDPPRRVRVRHTGAVVRGDGLFEVIGLASGESRVVMREDLDLPLGALGRAGFALVSPLFTGGVKRSLKRFARLVEAGELPS